VCYVLPAGKLHLRPTVTIRQLVQQMLGQLEGHARQSGGGAGALAGKQTPVALAAR